MTTFRGAVLAALIGLSGILCSAPSPQGVDAAPSPFLVKPYLQLGNYAQPSNPERLVLLWHTGGADADWRVEVKSSAANEWSACDSPVERRIAVSGIPPHRVYRAVLSGLPPGEEFEYRVLKGGKEVFRAQGRSRKPVGRPYRFVVFGDCGAGTASQAAVAYQIFQAKPDFVVTAGDIVYSNGRISEYRTKFFPIYNADRPSMTGAPLIRSTLFLAAPGNHDMSNHFPDGLAYFLYWDQPLNGPIAGSSSMHAPALPGDDDQAAFLRAAGSTYPRMGNFSFNYGNSHWTVLDSNRYVDWNSPVLRAWVAGDLSAAQRAAWRFVVFHHPPFHSSHRHFEDQWMRVLADVFQAGNVDVVFAGHVHNYQRSLPLRFTPKAGSDGNLLARSGRVDGAFALDRNFDGKARTKPNGILYLVTGAGGAGLYDPDQQNDTSSWQEFTARFFSNQHSFTLVNVDGKKLDVTQVAEDGAVLDQFTVSK
jgi:3',5'-cyclic AMP phosphodiesterase CpdA